MGNRKGQIYDDYWKYTAALTDYQGEKFLNALQTCVDFFDEYPKCVFEDDSYTELQEWLVEESGISQVSVRKVINQLVKLGFLKPYMRGYIPETLEYLAAKTERKQRSLLSKIVYQHSNFNNSMTDPDDWGNGQINFFLKTLEEVGSIDRQSLIALMSTDIRDYKKGFVDKDELQEIYRNALLRGFISRKYNQIQHFTNLLSKLDDLQMHDGVFYFKTDAERLFGNDEETRRAVRDPYLQRVYKAELEEESIIHYHSISPRCMLEGLAHPVLIASHIKPYKDSEKDEAFDANNGLLLSRNTDSLFDLGYMTFQDDGTIIPANVLDKNMADYLAQFRLHADFINPKRMAYMQYHRQHVFQKRYSSAAAQRYELLADGAPRMAAEGL